MMYDSVNFPATHRNQKSTPDSHTLLGIILAANCGVVLTQHNEAEDCASLQNNTRFIIMDNEQFAAIKSALWARLLVPPVSI